MVILGISDSHEAHACIFKFGKILAAAAEERFSRIKTDSGYPKKAIDKVIEESGIKKNEIDYLIALKNIKKLIQLSQNLTSF